MKKIKRAWVDPDGYAVDVDLREPYKPFKTHAKRPFFFDPDGIWHWGKIKPGAEMWAYMGILGHHQLPLPIPYTQYLSGGEHYYTVDGHLVPGKLEYEDWQVEKDMNKEARPDKYPSHKPITQEDDMDYTELIENALDENLSYKEVVKVKKYWPMDIHTYELALRDPARLHDIAQISSKFEDEKKASK